MTCPVEIKLGTPTSKGLRLPKTAHPRRYGRELGTGPGSDKANLCVDGVARRNGGLPPCRIRMLQMGSVARGCPLPHEAIV